PVAVEVCGADAAPMQFLDPPPRPLAQLVEWAELNGRRRARLGAGRHQAVALAIAAERTLVGVAINAAARDAAKGAGRHTVAAAVADVRLDVDVGELVVQDSARWTGMLARGRDAVLADVAHH